MRHVVAERFDLRAEVPRLVLWSPAVPSEGLLEVLVDDQALDDFHVRHVVPPALFDDGLGGQDVVADDVDEEVPNLVLEATLIHRVP